ncbi:MAG: hypothetical protein IT445_17530 [Phycisphaeraceae bacterium]|nr:hypothetical protein [Phycisphaeraceae bacterium]
MKRTPPRNTRRNRGSLLVLAVVALVIIAVLGFAVLQQNKMDRFAAAKHERNYTDLVINGIIDEIRKQLREDYFHNRYSFYGLYDYPWTDDQQRWEVTAEYAGPGNTPGLVMVNGTPKHDPDTTADRYDDTYLATTFPIVTGNTTVTWPHLSNLTGLWLDLPDSTVINNPETIPIEHPIIGNPGNPTSDAMIPSAVLAASSGADFEIRGTDTDGDGVLDAMWQWAPVAVRNLGGRKYVMAMRLIDSSSLINLNTATVNVGPNGEAYPSAEYLSPGYTPVDIDLSRLIARMPNSTALGYGTQGQRYSEIGAMMDRRFLYSDPANRLFGSSFASNPGPLTISERMIAWRDQASLYGNSDQIRFQIDNELELRYGGGLNNDKNHSAIEGVGTTTSDLRGLMRVTRNNQNPNDGNFDNPPLAEGSWNNVANNLYDWFQGGNRNTDPQISSDRTFPAVRHFLTTHSGHSVYQVDYGGAGGAGRLQCDLNCIQDAAGNLGKPPYLYLRDKIDNAFRHGGDITRYYLADRGVPDSDLTGEVIRQYALNIIDYGDIDIQPTEGGNYYGLEKLPFLREVYAQQLYKNIPEFDGLNNRYDTPAYDITANGVDPTRGYNIWVPFDNTQDMQAMAIEIGNPFSYTINAEESAPGLNNGLKNLVRVRIRQDPDIDVTWDFDPIAANMENPGDTVPDLEPRDDNDSDDDLMVIYSDQIAGTPDADGNGMNLKDELSMPTGRTVELKAGKFQFRVNDQPIIVELEVRMPDGSWKTYDRLTTNIEPPVDIQRGGALPHLTSVDERYWQRSYYRDSQFIRFVMETGTVGGDHNFQTAVPDDGAYASDKDQFGENDKSGADFAAIEPNWDDDFQLPHADGGYYSVAELGWMCMIGFNDTKTLSANLYETLRDEPYKLFLDVNPNLNPNNVPVEPLAGASGLPPVAMLFDQFTVLSPRYSRDDGGGNDDNDNSDGDNVPTTNPVDRTREMFIPGTINVNTASLEILTLATSLLDVGGGTAAIDATQDLMTMICAYRDDPSFDVTAMNNAYQNAGLDDIRNNANIPMNRTNIPGIASLGELLYINPGGGATGFDMLWYGRDNQDQQGESVDLYPDPITLNDTAASPKLAKQIKAQDGPEEDMARFQMLAQTLSVRSDVFAAYVVVRGYDATAFNAGPVEEARFLVILDRGAMANDNIDDPLEAPRVAGFIRLD